MVSGSRKFSQREIVSFMNTVDVNNQTNGTSVWGLPGLPNSSHLDYSQQHRAAQWAVWLWGVGYLISWPKVARISHIRFHLCVLMVCTGLLIEWPEFLCRHSGTWGEYSNQFAFFQWFLYDLRKLFCKQH